jgi:hypothetical protein
MAVVSGTVWSVHTTRSDALHDYLEWNRSREQVEAERERKRKAGRMGAESRWGK